MSEVAKPAEAAPPAPPAESTESTAVPSTTPAAATAESAPATDTVTSASETAPASAKEDMVKDGEAKIEANPASEGVLGYKGPRLIQSLRFSKRFFWFSDEALKTDTLDGYLRAEKADIGHSNAAWAHETGKGLMFFAKRAEDRTSPSGILNLAEITDLTKEGSNDFSFQLNGHKHVFQAASTAERAGWIVAIETHAGEAKGMKEHLVGSEGYKKHLERYSKLGVGAATTGTSSLAKSRERKETSTPPKKSLETKAKEPAKKDKADASSASSSDVEKKDKRDKSRSQSRKRSSIFGLLGNKKEEPAEKKEAKAEEKAGKKHDSDLGEEPHKKDDGIGKEDQKHEKAIATEKHKHDDELAKEEKKLQKEDANITHQPPEAGEAGAPVAAVGAPVVAATSHQKEGEEKKAEETKPESSNPKNVETQDKKGGKRGSIFGSLFGGKKEVTSPSTEKPEAEVAPVVPTTDDEMAPVSKTAPKIDEPIQNKPIDTAAVTAPMDSASAAHEPPADSAHAQTTTGPATSKGPSTPSHKGGVMGFFKRQESKIEPKKDAKADEPITSPTDTQMSAVSDTPVAPGSEGKPLSKERRRTSIFNSLSNKKDKKPGEATSEIEAAEGETKKSPLPQKLGGLFRRPSKAFKCEETQTEPGHTTTEPAPIAEATEGATASPARDESALINGTPEAPQESAEQVPNATANTAPEVKASA